MTFSTFQTLDLIILIRDIYFANIKKNKTIIKILENFDYRPFSNGAPEMFPLLTWAVNMAGTSFVYFMSLSDGTDRGGARKIPIQPK